MGAKALHESQMIMARYLRDPQNNPPPAGVEQRRLKIYEDLIYNNIEGLSAVVSRYCGVFMRTSRGMGWCAISLKDTAAIRPIFWKSVRSSLSF